MKKIRDILLVRDKHVCPWWCCFTFDNPIRRLFHDPARILGPFAGPGHTVADIGAGMGFFSIPLCALVGSQGKVIAVDIQERMLNALLKRAKRAGVAGRIQTRLGLEEGSGAQAEADFVLAFWMVHEVPDQGRFFGQVMDLMKPGARFLLVEPRMHVTGKSFEKTVQTALDAGFIEQERPKIALSRGIVLGKK